MRKFANNAEKEMFDLLSILQLPEIVGILEKLMEDLPENQQQFYKSEIDTWGSMGNKNVLINDILDIVDAGEVMGVVDDLSIEDEGVNLSGKLKKAIDLKYPYGNYPRDSAPTTKADPLGDQRQPSGPLDTQNELDRMVRRPDLDYQDKDLFEKEWYYYPPPAPDEVGLSLESLPRVEQESLRKQMRLDMIQIAQTMSKPYVVEMVGNYVKDKAPEIYQEMLDKKYFSRTGFGRNIPHTIDKFFKSNPPISDVYTYWDALVNKRQVPTFSENYEEYISQRYGGGKMGANIDRLYADWKNTPNEERRNPVEIPEAIKELKREFTIEDISIIDEVEDIPDYPESIDEDVPESDLPIGDDYSDIEDVSLDMLDDLVEEQNKQKRFLDKRPKKSHKINFVDFLVD